MGGEANKNLVGYKIVVLNTIQIYVAIFNVKEVET